eukprot:scaffold100767_cov45-Phaeocystis_antarctica.AAC.1
MAGLQVAAAAGAAAGRPSPRVDSSPTRAESRLEPLQPEAEGADDAVGAVPSLLRSGQTTPPPDAPPPDAPHAPE